MKLLYLYIDDFPPFKTTEMCFASGYFFRKHDNSLSVDFKCILPKNFFSPQDLLYVSALVGPNGAGKTSLIRILEAIKYPVKRAVFILVIEAKGDIMVYYDLGGAKLTVNATGCTIKECNVIDTNEDVYEFGIDCDDIRSCFNLVYYSPHYTLSNNLFHKTDRFLDISTTGLINKASEDCVVGGRSVAAAFKADEFRRLVQFYSSKKDLFPELHGIALVPNIYATNDITSCFFEIVDQERGRIEQLATQYDHPKRRYTDEELSRLGGMLLFLTAQYEDGFMQMVQALAAQVWNFGTYKESNFKEGDFGAELYRCLMGIKDIVGLNYEEWHKRILDFLKGHVCKKMGSCKIPVNDVRSKEVDNPLYEFFLRISKLESKSDKDSIITLVMPWHQVGTSIESLLVLYEHCSRLGSFVELRFDPPRSSGEYARHTFYARLFDHFAQIRGSVAGYDGSDFSREFAKHRESGWIVVLDEVEVALHPEWQRGLVDDLLREFNTYFQGFNVHFIFATHSPIILSDIPKGNVVFIDKEHKVVESRIAGNNTFGANIFDLYQLSFDQKDGTTGCFAAAKIQDLLDKVKDWVDKGTVRQNGYLFTKEERMLIELIGDPLVRQYLRYMQAEFKRHRKTV